MLQYIEICCIASEHVRHSLSDVFSIITFPSSYASSGSGLEFLQISTVPDALVLKNAKFSKDFEYNFFLLEGKSFSFSTY